MFIIDFNTTLKRFELSITDCIDRDEFVDNVNYLKTYYFPFEYENKIHHCDFKHLETFLLWFERDGKQFQVTDLAKEIFQKYKDIYYKRETEFYRGQEIDYSIFTDKVIWYDFQKEDIINRLSVSNYLDANDAGLGKSFINIAVASQRYKEGKIDGLIIIVPNGLNYHWKKEILNFVNVFKEEDIEIITNENKFQPFKTYKDKKILIISNHAKVFGDCLLSYRKDYNKIKSAKNLRWKEYGYVDIKKEWNKNNLMIIGDESHLFKYSDTIRTKALNSIKPYFKYKTLVTATPNINAYEHIYPQLNFIESSIIPMTEESFKIYISKEIGNQWGKYNIVKYDTEKIQEINNKSKRVFFRRLMEDVPEMKARKFISEVYFDLTKEQKKIYHLIFELELARLYEEYDIVTWKLLLNKLNSIMAVMDNPCILKKETFDSQSLMQLLNKWNIEQDPKFIALTSKLEDYIEEKNEKVVVYDYRPDTLDMLNIKFKKYNPVIIHGSLKGIKNKELDRQNKEDIFNYNKDCKLALLSSLTSSAGINLQKACHRILVYSMPFDGEDFYQLGRRTHRITSLEDTLMEIFNYPNTIDNIRVQRNLGRIELNDKLGKEISQGELDKLMNGEIK